MSEGIERGPAGILGAGVKSGRRHGLEVKGGCNEGSC